MSQIAQKDVFDRAALVVALLALPACSSQQLYTAAQDAQKVECQKYPDTRYEECMARLEKPYEEYERERESLDKE